MSINICFNDGAFFGPEWASTSVFYVCEPILTLARISLKSRRRISYREKNIQFFCSDVTYAIDWQFAHSSKKKKKSFRICCRIKDCKNESMYVTLFPSAILDLWQRSREDFFAYNCSRSWDVSVNSKRIVIDWSLTPLGGGLRNSLKLRLQKCRNDCYTMISRISV